MDAAVAKQLGLESEVGVVITSVTPGSIADRAGLETGMVISQVNRESIEDMADVEQALADYKAGEELLLLVKSEAGSRFVVIGS